MPHAMHSNRKPKWSLRGLRALKGLLHNQRGVSAVEFSLLAPFMVFGGIATVDAGMAIYEKMMISQVLRSGAQTAIGAQNETAITEVLEATAAENFTVAGETPSPGELQISVTSYCICPENTLLAIPCVNICVSTASPTHFYSLNATKQFTAVILPDFTLTGTIDVMAN